MIIQILRTADGAIRSYPDDAPWDDARDYMWSEGNYGCDCNRADLFARVNDDPDPDQPCGDSAYLVRITDDKGAELYVDDGWPERQGA